MNVLLVVPWDNIGGVCNVVNRVARHMSAQGHSVHYLLPGATVAPTETTSREGFPASKMYLRAPFVAGSALRSRLAFTLGFPYAIWRLVLLLRSLRTDIVNIHYPGGVGVYFAVLRRLGLVRVVTSIHGTDLLPNGVRHTESEFAIGTLLRQSDAIVTPSNAYQRAAQAAWPEMAGRRAQTIPNGIDPEELGYREGADEPASEPPYVLSILQLVRYKGVDVLIRAFAGLAPHYPTLRLKLISDGPNRVDFERLAESLGVADRIDFLGFVDRVTVARYLRGCTLFVLPSRSNSESFGISAAEAMAVDRPVVASRIGGLPELIDDGVSGLLVTPGDEAELGAAVRRILDDPAFARSLGRTAGQRVRRQFLWTRSGILYEDLFRQVGDLRAARPLEAPVTVTAAQAQYPAARRTPPAPHTTTQPSISMFQDRS